LREAQYLGMEVELLRGIETPSADGGPEEETRGVEGSVVKGGRLALIDSWVDSGGSPPTGGRVGVESLLSGIGGRGQLTSNRNTDYWWCQGTAAESRLGHC